MKSLLVSALLLISGSVSFGSANCSQLPKQGPVSEVIRLADGTTAVFKANLKITHIKEGIGQNTTSHSYDSPRVFVGKTEVAVTAGALNLVAKALGYESLGFRDLQVNGGYFRKRITMVSDGDNLRLVKSPKEAMVIDPTGSAKFFHPECADWQF